MEASEPGGPDGSAGRAPVHRALREALAEHRAHALFAGGLFAVGTLLGAALAVAGVDLLELVADVLGEELFPETEEADFELTARFLLVNNTQPFLLSIVGALTVGVLTAWIMLLNGVVLGNVGVVIGDSVGADYVLVGIAPHGVFELPALFLGAAVGFRLVHRFGQRVTGSREAFLSRAYAYRTGVLIAAAWGLLVVAAVVEAHVTPVLLEELFADRVGTGAGA